MAEHLRPLPRCKTCGKPATQALHNTWNAHQGDYCDRHANAALRAFSVAIRRTTPAKEGE